MGKSLAKMLESKVEEVGGWVVELLGIHKGIHF